MQDEDFLLREIGRLVRRLAAALFGRPADAAEVDEEAVASQVGLGLGTAIVLPPAALTGLLTTADGLDAPRALLLGLALAARAQRERAAGDTVGSEAAAARGAWLIDAAIGTRPELATPELLSLRNGLRPSTALADG